MGVYILSKSGSSVKFAIWLFGARYCVEHPRLALIVVYILAFLFGCAVFALLFYVYHRVHRTSELATAGYGSVSKKESLKNERERRLKRPVLLILPVFNVVLFLSYNRNITEKEWRSRFSELGDLLHKNFYDVSRWRWVRHISFFAIEEVLCLKFGNLSDEISGRKWKYLTQKRKQSEFILGSCQFGKPIVFDWFNEHFCFFAGRGGTGKSNLNLICAYQFLESWKGKGGRVLIASTKVKVDYTILKKLFPENVFLFSANSLNQREELLKVFNTLVASYDEVEDQMAEAFCDHIVDLVAQKEGVKFHPTLIILDEAGEYLDASKSTKETKKITDELASKVSVLITRGRAFACPVIISTQGAYADEITGLDLRQAHYVITGQLGTEKLSEALFADKEIATKKGLGRGRLVGKCPTYGARLMRIYNIKPLLIAEWTRRCDNEKKLAS